MQKKKKENSKGALFLIKSTGNPVGHNLYPERGQDTIFL